MRRIAGLLAASALATLATFAVSPGTAFAAAPRPACESGQSHFICDGMSTGTTVWTITYQVNGMVYTHNITTSTSMCQAPGLMETGLSGFLGCGDRVGHRV
jgi:hypothetical protein